MTQQAATLFRLFEAPHYFRRLGKGHFKKAPEEIVKAALLGIERKKQLAAQIDAWADELANGTCPPAVREQLYRILFRPDKNGAEYKAVVEAARRSHKAPLDLLTAAGAIDSPYQFHWKRFLFEHFPKGTGFAPLEAPTIKEALPLAPVQAFSIDDSQTTEIDDALSVQGLGSGTVVFGIHIAAPALAIAPDSPVDKAARDRYSTVYMPGYKLTMLPDEVVQVYTLMAGRECPAVSLYVTLDEATLAVQSTETRLDRVPIAANLRHDQLDSVITEATLTGEAPADYAFAAELAFAYRLARHLKAAREVVRGKPENFNRPDYNFRLVDGSGGEPRGDERVAITTRARGSSLDLIVAEAMILANSTWGGWIAECGSARHLPQPGQHGAWRQGAHGHQAGAARRHGRGAVHLGHFAAAPLCRSGQPVADHRLRPPRPHGGARGAVQAEGHRAVRDHFGLRCGLQRLQRVPVRHRALLDAAPP